MDLYDRDYGLCEEASDDVVISTSSEDEVEAFFADACVAEGGTRPIKKKPKSVADSDSEFESDMGKELESAFREESKQWLSTQTNLDKKKPSAKETSSKRAAAGSDEELKNTVPGSSQGQEKSSLGQEGADVNNGLTDDELFYNPKADEKDEAWVNKHRRSYRPSSDQTKPLRSSDAILNCPCCMTVLCLDCQRHETYRTQYRAMFVKNCSVKREEVLKYPKSTKEKSLRSRKRKLEASEQSAAAVAMETETAVECDAFHPVACSICNTIVAVYDEDEVYHFHNVLASH